MIGVDATAQALAIRTGQATSAQLTELYLDRIAEYDGDLRAYVTVDADGARASARRADELTQTVDPDQLPPFHGVALSVKDVVDIAGLPTTHSSKLLADNIASTDEPIVERFRRAGFILLGKTNVPEFCTSMTSSELNGVSRNPWDLERTPGGSSGGAAAALAAGLCAVSHGTDGAGSIRAPASFCGLVGLKPSRGLIAFGPDVGDPYPGTTVHGVLTRSVRDAAALLDVMTDPGAGRPRWSPSSERPYAAEVGRDGGRLRIAFTTDAPFGTTDEECSAATRSVAATLEALGHVVGEQSPSWPTILAAAAGPMSVPGPAGLVALADVASVEPRNRPVLEASARLTIVEHAQWVGVMRRASEEFLRFWENWDVLVTPTAGIPAPSVSWAPWDQSAEEHRTAFMNFPNFAQPFNISGQPAITLPLARTVSGLPIGIQLVGRPLAEATLVRVAAELETALPWVEHQPPAYV